MHNTINSVSNIISNTISASNAIGRLFWIVCFCALPYLSHAAAWQLKPEIALEGSYQDNARLKVDKADQDELYSASLQPTLTLGRYTDLTTLDGFIGLDFIKDWGDTGRLSDSVPRRILSGFSLTRKGELSRLNLRGRYFKDSIFRAANTTEEDDPEQPPTSGAVDEGFGDEDVKRQRIDIRPSFAYDITERLQVVLGYQFLQTIHDNPSSLVETRRLADFDRHSVNGRVSVPITEKNKLVSILSASRFDSEKRFEGDQERTTDNYELQAGLQHNFDETTSFTLTLGGRYTVFDVAQPRADNVNSEKSDTGFVSRLNAIKKTGLTTFNANLERKLSPSGVGDQVESYELNFNIARKLTEFTSVSFFAEFIDSEKLLNDGQENVSNRSSFRVEPSLRWTLTESWSLAATYRYERQKDFGDVNSPESPDTAQGNSAFLTLLYQPISELGK